MSTDDPDKTTSPDHGTEALLAILAIQNGFATRKEIDVCWKVWLRDQAQPFVAILRNHLGLTPEAIALLENLARHHLTRHAGNPQDALSSLQRASRTEAEPGTTRTHESGEQTSGQATTAYDSERSDTDEPGATTERDPDATAAYDSAATTAHDRQAEGPHFTLMETTAPGPEEENGGARFHHEPSPDIVTAVSHFRIERIIARGGLGVVYLARQLELNRHVALKESRATHHRFSDTHARFVLESEITAGLEHPDIVPTYDLGERPDGRPFYVMRLVRGETLQAAIDRFHRELSNQSDREADFSSLVFRQLLLRFLGVCQGIAYAHSRGIVHRDLKPSNIMLGAYGETIVVDWGLARPVGSEAEARPEPAAGGSPPHTPSSDGGLGSTQEEPLEPSPQAQEAVRRLEGAVEGTVGYMSPEQAAGDRVGFSTDIYSLGATLYYLLVGRNPFPSGDISDTLERARTGNFLKPREVRPDVSPALEAVCLKAMALRPENRYSSPRLLAEDLERWLADEPVSAWAEPRHVRLARWERKHRKLIRAGGLALGTVALVATIAAFQVEQARQATDRERVKAVENQLQAEKNQKAAEAARVLAEKAREEAERSFVVSREIADRFVPILEENLPLMSLSPAMRKELATECVDRYRAFVVARPDDPHILRQAAQVMRVGANIHRLLEDKEPSPGKLYDESLELLGRLEAIEGASTPIQDSRSLVITDRGAWRRMEGRSHEGAQDYEQSVQLARQSVAATPELPGPRFSLSVALWNLAGARRGMGKLDEARDLALEGLELIKPLASEPNASWVRKLVLVRSALTLAAIERHAGQPDAAQEVLEQAAGWITEMRARNPLQPDVMNSVADLQMERAQLAIDFPGRPRSPELERHCMEGLNLLDQLFDQHRAIPNYFREYANGYVVRAGLYRTAEKPDLARAAKDAATAQQVIDPLYKLHKKAENLRPNDHDTLGDVLAEQGRVAQAQGNPQTALARFDQAIAEYEASLAIDNARWTTRRALEQVRGSRLAVAAAGQGADGVEATAAAGNGASAR